jgi:hypothetical protein
MFSEQLHRTGLRPRGAFRFAGDEAHFRSDLERIEISVDDAVTMKVNLLSRRGGDKTAIPIRKKPNNPAVVRHPVQFRAAAALASMIFEATTERVEGVANGDVRILVRMVDAPVAADHDFAARHCEVYAHLEHIALLMARVLALHRNVAGGDPIEKVLEFLGTLPNAGLKRRRRIHMAKGNLERQLHRTTPLL